MKLYFSFLSFSLKPSLSFLLAMFLFSSLFYPASAQISSTPILTWRAQNFYPSAYSGKAPITPGTPVTASFEVIRGDKLVDLSAYTISWFADDKKISQGVGQKELLFSFGKGAGERSTLRVTASRDSDVFSTSAILPIEKPRVVIDAAYPSRIISSSAARFQMIPYFWNIKKLSDLRFSWGINNEPLRTSADNLLEISIASLGGTFQRSLFVSAVIENPTTLETVRSSKEFSITP